MRAALRHRRVDALARRLWPVAQTAIAGAIAWELARALPGHETPLFAPIVAIVAMGVSAGHRGRDAVVLVLGAALGIAVADVLVRLLGSGGLQIALVVFVSMALALFLSPEPLFITQAGISALLVVAVEREAEGWAPDRIIDALIGAGVALVMALLLFPLDPMTAVRRAARPVLDDLVAALETAAEALQAGDLDRAEEARATARRIDERRVLETLGMALGTARRAPRRRHARGKLAPFESAAPSLELLVRGVRTIAGASARVVRTRGGPAPEPAAAVASLAAAVAELRAWLEGELRSSPRTVRSAALEAARRAAAVTPSTEIGAGTITHLVEALAVELLRASGLDGAEAQRALRDSRP